MLTREQLTDDQWRTVRNTPHHVAIAVSAAGGSIFDEMLERAAAMSGIVDALNSRHPLVQGIGASADIMAAQDQVRALVSRPRGFGAARREPAGEGARHVQGCGRDARRSAASTTTCVSTAIS